MKKLLAITAAFALLAAWALPTPLRAALHEPITYNVDMKASSETPPNMSTGTGHATLNLSGNMLYYTVTVRDISGPPTAAHIHVGKPGVAGPPVYTFGVKSVTSGTVAEGSIDLSKIAGPGVSGDSLRVILANGTAYINVHTAKNPGGEIRGQVLR
jgi:hypothetical protein